MFFRSSSTSSDYFGSWVIHSFNSRDSIVDNTESLGIVERKMQLETVRQDFRHYRNSRNLDRILMMDADERPFYKSGGRFVAWVTNGEFFIDFCDGMLEFGEITEKEHSTLFENLEKHGIHRMSKSDGIKDKLSEEDIEELSNL